MLAPAPSAVREVLVAELAEEKSKRRDAEEGKRAAIDLAHTLSMQVDGLRGEVERLHGELRRIHVGSAESAEDARAMAAMFTRLAAEAEAVAAQKELEEAQQVQQETFDEDDIDTDDDEDEVR